MTRLLALFAGNPLIFIGAALAVFAFGAVSGGSVAWKIQGLRITAAEQEMTGYQQEMTRIYQEAQHAADIEREQASAAYERASKDLADSIAAGDAYRRCVVAGRCGRVQQQPTCAAGNGLSAPKRLDGPSADPVPLGRETTAEDPVIGDCAVTTLMLNSLQSDIENQPGYAQ